MAEARVITCIASLIAAFFAGYIWVNRPAPPEQTKEESEKRKESELAVAATPTEEDEPEKLETTVAAAAKPKVASPAASHSSQHAPAATVSPSKLSTSSVEISSRAATSRQDSSTNLTSNGAPRAVNPFSTLEDQEYYHGLCPRAEANRRLQLPGQFLVRATEIGPDADLVISAMDDDRKIVHITLRLDDIYGWYIGRRGRSEPKPKDTFATVVDLVEYYKKRSLSKRLRLAKAVPRPSNVLKHDWIVYDVKDKIGGGRLGSVYKGQLKRAGSLDIQEVAVKTSSKASFCRARMIGVLARFSHDNIVAFVGTAVYRIPVLLVTEYCIGGDLLAHLIKHGPETDTKEKLLYAYEIAQGLSYLHGLKCVHGSLSSRSCLISSQGRIKINGFSRAREIEEIDISNISEDRYRNNLSFGTDITALSVVIFEVFANGTRPWPEKDQAFRKAQFLSGNRPAVPSSMPAPLVALIGEMWSSEGQPQMSVIAGKIFDTIKDDQLSPELMTLNRLPGVKREKYLYAPVVEANKLESGQTSNADVAASTKIEGR